MMPAGRKVPGLPRPRGGCHVVCVLPDGTGASGAVMTGLALLPAPDGE